MHTLTCKPPTLTCVHICDDLHTHTHPCTHTHTCLKQNKTAKQIYVATITLPPAKPQPFIRSTKKTGMVAEKIPPFSFVNITYINIKQCLRKPFLQHVPQHLPGKSPRSLSATGPQGAALLCTSGRHRGSSVFLPISSGCHFKCVLQLEFLKTLFPLR